MSATITIDATGFVGGATPNSFVRIDLQNCSNPRVEGTGQIVPSSMTLPLVNGTVTATLFDNTQIVCGVVNVPSKCGCDPSSLKTSYYSFSFVKNGEVTSIGSYNLKPGAWNLWDLTPCIGSDCICGDSIKPIPVMSQVPTGTVDGVNKIFTLQQKPSILWLMEGGVFLTQGVDYTVTDNVITFSVAPSTAIYAVYTYGGCTPEIVSQVPAGTIDGTNAVFTLSTNANPQGIWLYNNGVFQTIGTDYSLSGSAITFTVAPAIGSSLYVDFVPAIPGSGNPFNTIVTEVPGGTIDGTNTNFTISSAPRFLMIQYNSALLQPGIGFTQAGTAITLAQAPQIGDVLLATLFS